MNRTTTAATTFGFIALFAAPAAACPLDVSPGAQAIWGGTAIGVVYGVATTLLMAALARWLFSPGRRFWTWLMAGAGSFLVAAVSGAASVYAVTILDIAEKFGGNAAFTLAVTTPVIAEVAYMAWLRTRRGDLDSHE